MHSSIQRDGHDKYRDSKFTKTGNWGPTCPKSHGKKRRVKATKGVGKLRGNLSSITWSKTQTQQMRELRSKGWVICWGSPSTRGVHMGLEPRPPLIVPGSPPPIFQSLPLHCSNMLSLLAGKESNSMCWLKMKGKGTAMFYPVILHSCINLQKPYWLNK